MSMKEAQGNLAKATQELMLHWQRTRGSWRDGRAEAFEREVLEPLAGDVKQALSAMSRMNGSLQQAKVRVSPPQEP